MRYSLKAKYRKYVQSYDFLSFARKFEDKYGKKSIDIATNTGVDAAKTASKRVVQETAENTGDLIGKKIAGKITSIGKSKNKQKEKEKKDETNEVEKIYIPSEKRQMVVDSI